MICKNKNKILKSICIADKLNTDYLCGLKLVHIFTIIFPYMQKKNNC